MQKVLTFCDLHNEQEAPTTVSLVASDGTPMLIDLCPKCDEQLAAALAPFLAVARREDGKRSRAVTTGSGPYPCPYCTRKPIPTKQGLASHIRRTHPEHAPPMKHSSRAKSPVAAVK